MERGFQRGRAEGVEHGRAEGVERGRAEGVERGLEQGLEQGEALTLIRILQKRLPGFSAAETTAISDLNRPDLDQLTDLVLEFSSIGELRDWLERLVT